MASSNRQNKKKVQEFLKRQGEKFPEIKQMQEQYNMEQLNNNNNNTYYGSSNNNSNNNNKHHRPDHLAPPPPPPESEDSEYYENLVQKRHQFQQQQMQEQEAQAARLVKEVDRNLIQTQEYNNNNNMHKSNNYNNSNNNSRTGGSMKHIQYVKEEQQRMQDLEDQSMFKEDEVEELIATFESENKKYRQDVVILTQQCDRLEKDYIELDQKSSSEIRHKEQQLQQAMADIRYLKEKNADSVGREIKLKADNKILRGTVKELHDSIKRITTGARDAVEAATEQSASMAQEIQSLKKNFIMAKQYKLHTALEHLSKDSMREQRRLQRIIAHMQAEKIALQALLQQAEDDRDACSMRLQLAKDENERMINEVNNNNAYYANNNDGKIPQQFQQPGDYIDDGYSSGGMQLSVIPENEDIGMENSGIDYNENNINNNTSGQKMEENNIMLRDYNTAPPALGNKVGINYHNVNNNNNVPLPSNNNIYDENGKLEQKQQMRNMEQELLQSLSIDTNAPTFETIDLIDENGNTPSANLEAVLVAMKQSVLSVDVPPSPIITAMDTDNKDNNMRENIHQQAKEQQLEQLKTVENNKMLGGIVKASKGFVSSPLVSTDVMDPEDDPIDSIKSNYKDGNSKHTTLATSSSSGSSSSNDNNKKNEDTTKSVANVVRKKKSAKSLWTKLKIGVAIAKPRRKAPPPPPEANDD